MSNHGSSNKLQRTSFLALGAVSALGLLAVGASASANGTVVVKPGDTVWGIANQIHTTTKALEDANQGAITKLSNSVDLIHVGQTLVLPNGSTSTNSVTKSTASIQKGHYVVQTGDTLSAIAKRFGVSVSQLMAWNHLSSADQLKVGQVLILNGDSALADEPVDDGLTAVPATQTTPTSVAATPASETETVVSSAASSAQPAVQSAAPVNQAPSEDSTDSTATAPVGQSSAVAQTSTTPSSVATDQTAQPAAASVTYATSTAPQSTTNSFAASSTSGQGGSVATATSATTTQVASQAPQSAVTSTVASGSQTQPAANSASTTQVSTSQFAVPAANFTNFAVNELADNAVAVSTTHNQSAASATKPQVASAAVATQTVNVNTPVSTAVASSATPQARSVAALVTSAQSATSTNVVRSAAPASSAAVQRSQTAVVSSAATRRPQPAVNQNNQRATQQQTTNTSSSVVGLAVKLANSHIPYVWGGASLSGMDCSGLVDYVYAHAAGKQLPHYTVALESYVNQKPVSQAQSGDLLFWGQHGATYHTAIYIGNNQYVAAPNYGQDVQVQTISRYFYPSFAGTVK